MELSNGTNDTAPDKIKIGQFLGNPNENFYVIINEFQNIESLTQSQSVLLPDHGRWGIKIPAKRF